jgi:hypothetical protein
MSGDQRHRGLLAVGLLMAFGGLAAWSCLRLQAGYQRAQSARENLSVCEQLAGRIERLRTLPSQASLDARSDAELTGLMDTAANQLRLPPRSIQNIDPQPIRRLEKSPYKVQATQVTLQNVTLLQLVSILMNVTRGDSELKVTELRLNAPHGADPNDNVETWDAEATLTQLIFSPTSPDTRR